MFEHHSLPVLFLIFMVAAAAVWGAGIYLSRTTDVLDDKLHLGAALGGLILLAVATNLPEIAITWTAARSGDLSIATGNILGGIAVQTLVLVLLDVANRKSKEPLSYTAASLVLVLEAVLVIAVLGVAVMAHNLPATLTFARIDPGSLVIAALWIAGVWLVGKARKGLPWQAKGDAPGGQEGTPDKSGDNKKSMSAGRAGIIFAASALITLVGGVALEQSGEAIAKHIHMTGVLFGATVLAVATSLPEISTGLASLKQKDYQLAISDIFGGNAFLPVLFLLASLLSGKAALAGAQKSDIYLAGLGMLLTAVYAYGLVFRPKRRILSMGIDSFVVLLLYALGIIGLVFVGGGK